jgi:hypothetical protein
MSMQTNSNQTKPNQIKQRKEKVELVNLMSALRRRRRLVPGATMRRQAWRGLWFL